MTSDYQQLEVIRPQRNGSKAAGANIHSSQLSLKCEHEMKTISVMQNFEKFTSHETCLRKLLKISTNSGNKPSKKKVGDETQKTGVQPKRGTKEMCQVIWKRHFTAVLQCEGKASGKLVILSRKTTSLGKNESERLVWYLVRVNLPQIISISEKVRS